MGVGLLIGCVPPIALLAYVWYLDRAEHEPVSLVVKVAMFSAFVGVFAAAFIEGIGGALLEATAIGYIPLIGNLVYYFGVVAVTEEFCKRFAMMRVVWNNPAFDYRFDAVVYCVASAIGFAVAENAMYILMYGADVSLGRLIPVHTICGVFMGYYLGCAKICERGGNQQARGAYLRQSLLIPVAIHGAWDFCVSSESVLLYLAALAGIIALTAIAWRKLHQFARFDAPLQPSQGA